MATESLTQPVRRPTARPLVDLRGAGVTYPGQSTPALSPLNLAVRHGDLVTLTGPAGSGKTTLLNIVGLLQRPTTGSYLLNGIDTAKFDDGERTSLRGRLIGHVFQRPRLLPARSVLDNVTLPLLYAGIRKHQRNQAAMEALDRVGLADQMQAIVRVLPGGQQQRVAIARAIVTDPSLLVCDDPTASLDQAAADQIIGLLVGLHKDGRTVLVATRDQLAAAHSSGRLAITAGGSSMYTEGP